MSFSYLSLYFFSPRLPYQPLGRARGFHDSMRSFFTLALVVVSLSFCTALAAPTPNDQIERLQELREYESHQKYFREPGTHDPGDNELLGHYDDRFFRGLLSYDDKRDAQVNMIRAYLRTFRAHGIETWVAHGTLLGWWWNGKVGLTESFPSGRCTCAESLTLPSRCCRGTGISTLKYPKEPSSISREH